MKHYFLFLFYIPFFLTSCGSKNNEKKEEYSKKYECDNIDDCLSKYKFDGARAYLGLENPEADDNYEKKDNYKNLEKKIVIAEAEYWSGQNEFDKALSIIDASNLSEDFKRPLKLSLYDKAVIFNCEKQDWNKALSWALKAPIDREMSGWATSKEEESAQAVLKDKIDYLKNNSK